MDNIYAEKQQRLLTEPLYCSWASPDGKPFLATANVGLFYPGEAPRCPDVMLSMNVPPAEERRVGDKRSYFSWIIGKVPDVVIEIVSHLRGKEDSDKMRDYERWAIPYYVIYDPDEVLTDKLLRAFALEGGRYVPIDPAYFPNVGLGLKLWTGIYESDDQEWLRWYDAYGKLVPTGRELSEQEKKRADTAEEKMCLMAERLKALGESVD